MSSHSPDYWHNYPQINIDTWWSKSNYYYTTFTSIILLIILIWVFFKVVDFIITLPRNPRMDDMKDKFKGFMKKVNLSSSSGKFKGQGRVLGSSSGPTNQSPYVNPTRNPNPNPPSSKPSSSQKTSVSSSSPSVSRSSLDDKKSSNVDHKPIPNRPPSDGFDPFDSLMTTAKRNKNGFSLNVFECPVCNCGFGSEEEVSIHIESCIADPIVGVGVGDGDSVADLGIENADESMNKLDTCVAKYLSGNPSDGCVEIVLRLLRNIVKEPENSKFRRIRMSNPKIREAIGDVLGGIDLLECVGFELKEEEGEIWALMMETPSEDTLVILKDSVKLLENMKNVKPSAKEEIKKSEPLVIDRQVKVFFSVPESVAARIELPDSFYNLSLEEARREAEMRKKKMAESQLLIPKSLREKQAQASRRRYTKAIIRVQFPDGVVLQGVFSPREPTSVLYEFVCSALKQPALEFELMHPIPVKRRVVPCFPKPGEKASTLEEEDLVPSALVKFKPFETDSMVFTGLTNELLMMSEPLTSTTS